jgi:hypothetical protein
LTIKIVPYLPVQTHPIGDLPVMERKYNGWIGRQPWVLVFSITGIFSVKRILR